MRDKNMQSVRMEKKRSVNSTLDKKKNNNKTTTQKNNKKQKRTIAEQTEQN